jgi:WD40-like Beta Propeller Repeat
MEQGTASPLTPAGPHTVGASFSQDGSRLVFGFGANVFIQWTLWPPEGPFQRGRAGYSEADWLGNEALVFRGVGPTGGEDLLRADLATGDTTVVLAWPGVELGPVVSPDQRWVAFFSDRTGVREVYITDATGSGTPVQISRGGGVEPRWSSAGNELFYRVGDWIVSVPLRTGRSIEVAGRPDSLFTGPYLFEQGDNWDVLPDGRFLVIQGDPSVGRQIEVVTNWFEELRAGLGN